MADVLLSEHDTRQLDQLALGTAAAHAAASVAGLRHARSRGYGLETTDHRPYRPGDDPRQIDWNAEARLQQLSVRVLQAEGQAHLHVVLDASLSMCAKFAWAKRLSAALTYLAIARRDLAGLSLFADGTTIHMPATRGRAHLHRLLERLDASSASGTSQIDRALSEVAHRVRPPAFVVVISDFYTPGFGLEGLAALSARGLDPAVIQLVSDEEVDPPFEDGAMLEDLEGPGSAYAVVADYRERFAQMTALLEAHCRVHGMPWLQLRTSSSFDHALNALVRAGVVAGRR